MPRALILIRSEPYYRCAAVVAGLERLGYKILFPPAARTGPALSIFKPDSEADLLVMWNLKQIFDEAHAKKFEMQGGTVIVMENGYLQKVDKTYYALSTHGHNGSGWYPYDLSIDRFSDLGIPHQPHLMGGGHILLCGQRGVGSRDMASPIDWHVALGKKLKREFDGQLEIRIRLHPGNFTPRVPLETDLHNAAACAVWSSASGVRALVEGVPVFYDAPHWICSDAARQVPTLARGKVIEPAVSFAKVRRSLNRMAWGQWTPAEIESGEPFARMKSERWGPRWL